MCIEAAPFHVDTLALCNHVSLQLKLLFTYCRRLWYAAGCFLWERTCVQSRSQRVRLKRRPIHVLLQRRLSRLTACRGSSWACKLYSETASGVHVGAYMYNYCTKCDCDCRGARGVAGGSGYCTIYGICRLLYQCVVTVEVHAGWQVAAAAGPPPADCFMTELSGLLEGPEVPTPH